MTVSEVSYIAVPSGDNTNYYRITVEADTYLGVAKYDSSWFPALAVDRLYGSVATEDTAQTLKTEQDIVALIDEAILDTTRGYLAAAKDPNSSDETVLAWLTAQRRVRATAGDGIGLPDGAVEIEYNPGGNLTLRHSGEKRVFVLSSDPTEVMNAINAFASSQQTSATVLRIADVVRQRRANDIERAEADVAVQRDTNTVIVTQIDGALQAIAAEDVSRDEVRHEVEALLMLIESSR